MPERLWGDRLHPAPSHEVPIGQGDNMHCTCEPADCEAMLRCWIKDRPIQASKETTLIGGGHD